MKLEHGKISAGLMLTWVIFALDTANSDTPSSTTSTQHCEGDDGHSEGASNVVSHHKNTVTKQVMFNNQGQDNGIQSNSSDLSTTQPDEW